MDKETIKQRLLNLSRNVQKRVEQVRQSSVSSAELQRRKELSALENRTERSFNKGNKAQFLRNIAQRDILLRQHTAQKINAPYNRLTRSKGKVKTHYGIGIGYKPPRLI